MKARWQVGCIYKSVAILVLLPYLMFSLMLIPIFIGSLLDVSVPVWHNIIPFRHINGLDVLSCISFALVIKDEFPAFGVLQSFFQYICLIFQRKRQGTLSTNRAELLVGS